MAIANATDAHYIVGMKNLLTADQMIKRLHPQFKGQTYSAIGRALDLSDEFVRMVLLRKREPSKAFLQATGYERVTLYRRKDQ